MNDPTPSTSQCLSPSTLEKLLQERLGQEDERAATRHIDECSRCQTALERLCATDSQWSGLPAQLAPKDWNREDGNVADSFSDESWQREISWLHEYLEPANRPSSLGRLGPYEILEVIGQGSSAVVVKAFEARLHRYVAIKILSPSYASHGPARVRFEREGRAVAAVCHAHVVPIHAVDEFRGLPYIVMRLAGGGSLQRRIERDGPLDTPEVVRLGLQIAEGLTAAHGQGIVHRDVKPENVLLEEEVDRAMVTDFGLARVADDAAMTRSGIIAGTPQYMSPEQARGELLDERTDLFSLGSVLYSACTGHPPFRSETIYGVISRVCDKEPVAIRDIQPRIPEWLARFIQKLHSKNREERFDSAAQVADLLALELAHLQNPTVIPQPERKWLPIQEKKPRHLWFKFAAGVLSMMIAATALALGTGLLPLNLQNPPSLDPGDDPTFVDDGKSLSDDLRAPPRKEPLGIPGQMVTVKRAFTGGVIDGYTLYLPRNYGKADVAYPLIICLQGGQAVGGRIELVNGHGLPLLLKDRFDLELGEAGHLLDTFIVASPHMIAGEYDQRQFYDQEPALRQLLFELNDHHHVDSSRVYLTGAGRGGHGTWGLANDMSDVFAAFVPVSGMAHGIDDYGALSSLKIWAAHNICDSCVPYTATMRTVEKIDRHIGEDGEAFSRLDADDSSFEFEGKTKIFTTINRDDSSKSVDIYRMKELYLWLLQQKKDSPGATVVLAED